MATGHPGAQLDASRLEVTNAPTSKPVPNPDSPEVATLKDGTGRMIVVSWTSQHGWKAPRVVPYGPTSLMPTASALQYATQYFEGMKAFRGFDGRLRLFRPLFNCERLRNSASRIALPSFDPKELLKLIHKLCALESSKWLPKDNPGAVLYVRPTLIGSDSSLGFKAPEEVQLYIFMLYSPSPKTTGLQGTRLLASSESVVRAWPGGTGAAKVGGNYAAALAEHVQAKERGFDQVLWLYGPDRQITEAGAANIFVIWKTASGSLRMVTSPLDENNLILAGHTRRSIIEPSQAMFDTEDAGDELRREVLEGKRHLRVEEFSSW
jgi:branched-chain amino acid aminotransferase